MSGDYTIKTMGLVFTHPEFEQEVREKLGIHDRPITESDAQRVEELDLYNFDFREEDTAALFHFRNLKKLDINLGSQNTEFWDHFPKLQELYWCCWGSEIDFSVFANLHDLTWLHVSGGDYSDIAFRNLNALEQLQNLTHLGLHEFGYADLSPLAAMPQLKSLALEYSSKINNIAVISEMVQLEELSLIGLCVANLDFLDTLPDTVKLEMCGIEISDRGNPDVAKWKRFRERDICEISIQGRYCDYIDLSPLNDSITG